MECLGIPFRRALASPGSTPVVLAMDADRLLPEPGGLRRETVPARDLAQGTHCARSRDARDTSDSFGAPASIWPCVSLGCPP
jgi:hypothetical protein